jgi:hypothetical protein
MKKICKYMYFLNIYIGLPFGVIKLGWENHKISLGL